SGLVDVGHIALSVQIGHDLVVHVLGEQAVLGGSFVVVVGGAIHDEVIAVALAAAGSGGTDSGHVAFQLLRGVNALDIAVGVGVDHHVVLRKLSGIKLIAGG